PSGGRSLGGHRPPDRRPGEGSGRVGRGRGRQGPLRGPHGHPEATVRKRARPFPCRPPVAPGDPGTAAQPAPGRLGSSPDGRGGLAVTPLIAARGLVKRYGGRAVVDGIDVDVYPGEVLSVIGPNGAGKSTTLEMILGLR